MNDILLPNRPTLGLHPPPCTRFALPAAREKHLSMPEIGEKERDYLFCPSRMVPKRCRMAAMPGFKSQRQSSSATPFLSPLTIVHSCQHFHIFPALLGCHSKPMEPIISKLSHRHYNQGELPPSSILGGSHSCPPGSKHGHSYLTYP